MQLSLAGFSATAGVSLPLGTLLHPQAQSIVQMLVLVLMLRLTDFAKGSQLFLTAVATVAILFSLAVQEDGRVIDYQASDRSTSEGQAYAMLYPALHLIDPDTADKMLEKKLLPQYKQGIWDDQSAYYTQNLAWIGLLPPTAIEPQLLQPQ